MTTIATADLYDERGDELDSLALQLHDIGGHVAFDGPVRTIRCHRDNALVKELLATPAAKLRTLRTSARKLNLVAQSIRGLKVQRALNELEFSHKRIAQDVRKALYSAISNAENNHNLDIDNLIVAEAAGYRFGDFWRLGLPLLLLYGVAGTFLVPLIWPL